MHKNPITVSVKDIKDAMFRLPLIGMLGWQDVRQRYRRSSLGPFWLTFSMLIMIGTIGFVFGRIFDVPMQEYLPFLTVGIIVWAFISSSLSEGCNSFVSAEGIIKQLPIPLFVYVARIIWRNILIFFHNILILPFIFIAMEQGFSWLVFLSVVGLFILFINLAWSILILAVVCARYRDMPQVINSALQVAFYVSPIMWLPSLIPDRVGLGFLQYNPFYHLIEIVRSPLLGVLPTATNWAASIIIAIVGWGIALVIYGQYRHRISYWV